MSQEPEQAYAPGLSEDFVKALHEFEDAKENIKKAKLNEAIYLIKYLIENMTKAGIRDYRITDPAYNIESILEDLKENGL
jgi:hypothetical protein